MSTSGPDEPLVRSIDEDETVSHAVIRAVAEVTERRAIAAGDDSPGGLGELYEAVDPDALDGLFRGEKFDGCVEFHWEGCNVKIEGGTYVIVSRMGRTA